MLLEVLRTYWRVVHPRPWLFPVKEADRPISRRTVQVACQRARRRMGWDRKLSVHSLRHACATHLLDAGSDVGKLQVLPRHSRLVTTGHYTRVGARTLEG